MGKLVKNYIYNVMYQMLVFIAPLVTAPYLTRVLGAERLGISNYVLTVATVFGTVGLIGTQNYAIREVAYVKNNPRKLEETFYEIFTLRFVLGILTLLVYALYIHLAAYPYLMLIMTLYVSAWFIDPCWFFIGMEDMGKAVARNFFAKAGNVIGIFIFVKTQDDYVNYIWLLSSMMLLASLLAIPQLWKYFHIHLVKVSLTQLIYHTKGALGLFWPQMAILVYISADKILLEYLISPASVAYYDQAEKLIKIPLSFITVLSTVMMPRLASQFASHNMETIRQYLAEIIRFSAFLSFPMMFGIMGIASTLVPWFLGKEFEPVVSVIWALAPLIPLSSMIGISGDQYLVATGQTKVLTLSYIVAALVNVVVNIILIPRYAAVGSAIATICAYGLILVIQYKVLLREISLLDPILNSFSYIWKSIPIFLFVLGLAYILHDNFITTLLQILGGGLLYIGVLLITKDKMIFFLLKSISRMLTRI